MSKVENLWRQIERLPIEEKIVIYRRMEEEMHNKFISIHGMERDYYKEDHFHYKF